MSSNKYRILFFITFFIFFVLPKNIEASSFATAPTINLTTDSTIHAATIYNGYAYVGGDFSSINGLPRKGLAQIDLSTGQVTSWDPSVDTDDSGGVYAMLISTSTQTMYIGGFFNLVGGVGRNHIAEISLDTGLPTAWDPNPNSFDYTYYVTGLTFSANHSSIYILGNLSHMGGQTRYGVAEVRLDNGLATSWNPISNLSDELDTLVLSPNSTAYIAGFGIKIGGQARSGLGEVRLDNGLATSWNPTQTSSHSVVPLVLSSRSTLYAGGNFTDMSGQPRNNLAEIDLTTANTTSWNPNPDSSAINALASSSSSTLFVGGKFTTIGGRSISGLAEIDQITGLATSWNSDFSLTRALTIFIDPNVGMLVGGEHDEYSDPRVLLYPTLTLATTPAPSTASTQVGSSHNSRSSQKNSPAKLLLSLQERLVILLNQVAALKNSYTLSEVCMPPTTKNKNVYLLISKFGRDLDLEANGSDVEQLQKFLIVNNTGPSSKALAKAGATGYFLILTKSALAEYQKSVCITPNNGYFGPITRAWLENLKKI